MYTGLVNEYFIVRWRVHLKWTSNGTTHPLSCLVKGILENYRFALLKKCQDLGNLLHSLLVFNFFWMVGGHVWSLLNRIRLFLKDQVCILGVLIDPVLSLKALFCPWNEAPFRNGQPNSNLRWLGDGWRSAQDKGIFFSLKKPPKIFKRDLCYNCSLLCLHSLVLFLDCSVAMEIIPEQPLPCKPFWVTVPVTGSLK